MTVVERLSQHESLPVRFTADEFMQLVRHPPVADWTGKIELVDGEIVRMSPANIPHWRVQHGAAQQLRQAFEPAGPGWLVGPEPTVRFADGTVRLPDIGVLREPDLSLAIFDVAALFLAVEVADTSLRIDLGAKLRAYADAEIAHYWVIDVNARRLIAMSRPEAGGYQLRADHLFGEPIPVPGTDAAIVIE